MSVVKETRDRFICDKCGTRKYSKDGELPEKWTVKDRDHLCPKCSKITDKIKCVNCGREVDISEDYYNLRGWKVDRDLTDGTIIPGTGICPVCAENTSQVFFTPIEKSISCSYKYCRGCTECSESMEDKTTWIAGLIDGKLTFFHPRLRTKKCIDNSSNTHNPNLVRGF